MDTGQWVGEKLLQMLSIMAGIDSPLWRAFVGRNLATDRRLDTH